MNNRLRETKTQEEKLVHYLTAALFGACGAGGWRSHRDYTPPSYPGLGSLRYTASYGRQVLVSKLMYQKKNTCTIAYRQVDNIGQKVK